MTHREDRRFLKREVLEARRLQSLAGAHPLMGPLLAQRVAGLETRLAALPPGEREPRTVLFFSGAPVRGSEGIDARFACAALLPFLEMVKSEYSAEKHGEVGERGPRKDEDKAKLLLTGLPRGSFGLELSQPESGDLFTGQQLSEVLVRLTDLLGAAGRSDEEFVHALDEVSPRVHGRLKDFFEVLHRDGAGIRMQTGDLEFTLDQERIGAAVARVSAVHSTEEEEQARGIFRGATLDTWRFDFRRETGEAVSGRLSGDLIEAEASRMLGLANQNCLAHLKITRTTTQGGAVRTRFVLLALEAAGPSEQPVEAAAHV